MKIKSPGTQAASTSSRIRSAKSQMPCGNCCCSSGRLWEFALYCVGSLRHQARRKSPLTNVLSTGKGAWQKSPNILCSPVLGLEVLARPRWPPGILGLVEGAGTARCLGHLHNTDLMWRGVRQMMLSGLFQSSAQGGSKPSLSLQGTHKSLKGNARALSTVTAIIDGTGSVGKPRPPASPVTG